jgi:hypothetical protein
MIESNVNVFLYDIMNELKDRYSVRKFIINYVKSLIDAKVSNYMEETENNIYPTLLNHDNYNIIKKLWYPLPQKEEIIKEIRQNKIDSFLTENNII